jgi:hypothetical protein
MKRDGRARCLAVERKAMGGWEMEATSKYPVCESCSCRLSDRELGHQWCEVCEAVESFGLDRACAVPIALRRTTRRELVSLLPAGPRARVERAADAQRARVLFGRKDR